MTYLRFVTVLTFLVYPLVVHAQDPATWHQWGGPHRNFHIDSVPLAKTWPEDGPPRLWSRSLGEGYSSIVVDGEMLVTMYRDGDEEIVIALATSSGRTLWRHTSQAPLAHNGYIDILSLIHI